MYDDITPHTILQIGVKTYPYKWGEEIHSKKINKK